MGRVVVASVVLLVAIVAYLAFGGERFDPATIRNQRVLVTGASAGIGEQLAYEYARLGAKLVITARTKDVLQTVSRTCKKLGAPDVYFVAADMGVLEDRARVVEVVKDSLGGLDHLVLNHAIQTSSWWLGTPENFTLMERIFRVNFVAYVDIASKAMSMLEASRGRIGIVSSSFGLVGGTKSNAYGSSKFALQGFFSSLRQEMRHKKTGVSVTFAVLGPVASGTTLDFMAKQYTHIPHGFVASPEATAKAIVENVSLRTYRFVFDWKIRLLFYINDVNPTLFENSLSDIMQNWEESPWFVRICNFVFFSVFSDDV